MLKKTLSSRIDKYSSNEIQKSMISKILYLIQKIFQHFYQSNLDAPSYYNQAHSSFSKYESKILSGLLA